jgi:hypothetical protein
MNSLKKYYLNEKQQIEFMIGEYESRAKELDVFFQTDLRKIDLKKLTTAAVQDLSISNYEIANLKVSKVLDNLVPRDRERILKKTIFCSEKPFKTIKLIEYIESGNKLIPPILEPISKTELTIRDGFHRLALFCFLNLKEVPFLIPTSKCQLVLDLK